jgi:hypothetical protein
MNMIEQLFGSKTRVKLLQLFYSNPNRSFYVREITRKIDEQINSVRRELANLLSVGIISSDNTNNRLYYEVNQTYEYYAPLRAIFGQGGAAAAAAPATKKAAAAAVAAGDAPAPAKKGMAAPNAEVEKIKALGNVEVALYTGQFTRDESSGIDALIVGDINQHALQKFMAELEAQEGKEIRYTHMPSQEFNYRRQIKDRFISTVLTAKKQVLIDKNSIL